MSAESLVVDQLQAIQLFHREEQMVLTRRHMISGAVASMAASQVPAAVFARWEPSERYPGPRRSKYWIQASLRTVWRWLEWSNWQLASAGSEGPVWFGDGRYLLWSDIPNNRIMKWEEETGRVSVFRKPSNNANGNTRDRQGRLITCEHDTRRVTRTESPSGKGLSGRGGRDSEGLSKPSLEPRCGPRPLGGSIAAKGCVTKLI